MKTNMRAQSVKKKNNKKKNKKSTNKNIAGYKSPLVQPPASTQHESSQLTYIADLYAYRPAQRSSEDAVFNLYSTLSIGISLFTC